MNFTQQIRHASRRLLFLCAVVLLHSLFPSGYMPTSLASGWPVMLCPDGLPEGFLAAINGHHSDHHQHDDHTNKSSASDNCPVGKAFKTSAIPTAVIVPEALYIPAQQLHVFYPNSPTFRPSRGFDARAPPFSQRYRNV